MIQRSPPPPSIIRMGCVLTRIPSFRAGEDWPRRFTPMGPRLRLNSFIPASMPLPSFRVCSRSPLPPSRPFREIPRELTVKEIKGIVRQFGEASRRAQEAECDAVQIHCAHMHHLLGGFLSPLHNKRTDAYGGSLEGRLRLPLEGIRHIRSIVGPGFPILVRISGDEFH